jgi:hypothetical protein
MSVSQVTEHEMPMRRSLGTRIPCPSRHCHPAALPTTMAGHPVALGPEVKRWIGVCLFAAKFTSSGAMQAQGLTEPVNRGCLTVYGA